MIIRTTIEGVTKEKSVKNLGWVLRHWNRIHSFTFDKRDADNSRDGILTVTLYLKGSRIASNNNKIEAITPFVSEAVLWNVFLRRPIFYGLQITTIDKNGKYNPEFIERRKNN